MKELKICPIHGETEHVFYEKSSWNGQWKCLKCQTEESIIKKQKKKLQCVQYKGGKCEICGYDKNYSALEFHHLNPQEKDFTISKKYSTWESTKEELDKCILICSNCHREIHNPNSTLDILNTFIEKHNKNKEIKKLDSKRKIPLPSLEEIEEIHLHLKKYEKVAKYFNVSLSTLKRYLKKYRK